MPIHTPPSHLLRSRIKVVVVGCGGTGSALTGALPYLHQALLAYGHPFGLHLTVYDGDVISEHNCVRQPFARSEVGLHKATVLVNRLNLFWGVEWQAVPHHLDERDSLREVDLVIGCVDTRAARSVINKIASEHSWASYWLDIGNNPQSGQVVLGQPLNLRNRRSGMRLRTVAELYPSIIDAALDDPQQPSCSAAESLDRQHPFVNQTLANHALALLAQLFRGGIDHHGLFVNLDSGRAMPMPIDPKAWRRVARHRQSALRVHSQTARV